MTHHLTPVQKRVLAFMFTADQTVTFEHEETNQHGRPTATEFVNGFIVRCAERVRVRLEAHGYIERLSPAMSRWILTEKGTTAIGGCDRSPTRTHFVGDSGRCCFCKRHVARDMDR